MKTKTIFTSLLILTLIFSCSKESLTDENFSESSQSLEEIESTQNNLSTQRRMPDECFITGAMVNGETSATGAPYTVYASSGRSRVNYDRRVTVTLIDYVDNLLLAQRNVTIKANENVSENAGISEQICSDNITAVVTEVRNMTNFSVDNSCTWRSTGTYSMDSCINDPDIPCSVPGYGPCDQNPLSGLNDNED